MNLEQYKTMNDRDREITKKFVDDHFSFITNAAKKVNSDMEISGVCYDNCKDPEVELIIHSNLDSDYIISRFWFTKSLVIFKFDVSGINNYNRVVIDYTKLYDFIEHNIKGLFSKEFDSSTLFTNVQEAVAS